MTAPINTTALAAMCEELLQHYDGCPRDVAAVASALAALLPLVPALEAWSDMDDDRDSDGMSGADLLDAWQTARAKLGEVGK